VSKIPTMASSPHGGARAECERLIYGYVSSGPMLSGGLRRTALVSAQSCNLLPPNNSLERTQPQRAIMSGVDWLRHSARSR